MAIERSNRPLAAARIAATVRQLLDASTLCAIATVTPGGRAHINTAYFAWSRDFEIVWLSEPRAKHSRNLRANDSVAIGVYDSRQMWGKPDRGIQLFGAAREVPGEDAELAETLYAKRFPDFAEADLSAYDGHLPLRCVKADARFCSWPLGPAANCHRAHRTTHRQGFIVVMSRSHALTT